MGGRWAEQRAKIVDDFGLSDQSITYPSKLDRPANAPIPRANGRQEVYQTDRNKSPTSLGSRGGPLRARRERSTSPDCGHRAASILSLSPCDSTARGNS